MGGLFNPDNKFFRTMSKICDMFIVSLLWLVCCIPLYFVISIVTSRMEDVVSVMLYMLMCAVLMIPVGPAMSSLYYVCMKVIRRDRGYVTREYFHAFKMNFKVGAITGAIYGALAALLSFNLQYAYAAYMSEGQNGMGLFAVMLAITFALIGVLAVIFPILSRFTYGVGQLFRVSVYMAYRHIFHTLLILVIEIFSALAIFYVGPAILFMPAAGALMCTFPMERVLKKYMPKPENTVNADGDLVHEGDVVSDQDGERKDMWYLE